MSHACEFNAGVDCEPRCRHCEKCGWNPEVRDFRLECLRDKRRIEEYRQKNEKEHKKGIR